jgi:hypothetical protein
MLNNNLMNINNLYKFSDNSLKCNNCMIHILDFNFLISFLSINCENKNFYLYSNEALYLIHYNYPKWPYYHFFVNHYNSIIKQINNSDTVNYNKNVISFITTFARGSVHGYSGFYYILINYIQNIELYKNLDIILYDDCDIGIKQIIEYLCYTGVIKNNIIYLKKNIKYKFISVIFIENKNHVFNDELENNMTSFIQKFIINNNIHYNNSNYCILKTNNSKTNINNNGVFEDSIVSEFCNKYNFDRIKTNDEIDLINRIYSCKILILNYGSTFFKNYVYISDYCEKIIIIINGDVYIKDYNHLSSIVPSKFQGIIYKKYKNATFHYIITNNTLEFNPYTL